MQVARPPGTARKSGVCKGPRVGQLGPHEKLSFTLALCAFPTTTIPSCSQLMSSVVNHDASREDDVTAASQTVAFKDERSRLI